MPMRIIIVGLGAQAKYTIDIFRQNEHGEVAGLIDVEKHGPGAKPEFQGVPILGGLEALKHRGRAAASMVLVAHRDNIKKASLAEQCRKLGYTFATAIHPAATISPFATIGEGCIVNAGAVIQPNAVVGSHVMIHARVGIDHDCKIDDFANLAPGCTLAGHVKVGRMAYVYTGAVVAPNIRIGDRAEVGAGSVVLKDVPKGWRVAGNPAKRI